MQNKGQRADLGEHKEFNVVLAEIELLTDPQVETSTGQMRIAAGSSGERSGLQVEIWKLPEYIRRLKWRVWIPSLSWDN